MHPARQGPNARHPITFAVQVASQPADPQDRLADRQCGRLHPLAKVAHQRPGLVRASRRRRRGVGGLRQVPQRHDPRRHLRVDRHGFLQSIPGLQAQISTRQPLLSVK